MAQEVLISLSYIIGVAALVTFAARIIRQPPIIAYLIAGVLVGPLFLNIMGGESSSMLQVFSHIGVAFLLFIIGLNLDFRVLKEVGGVASVAGIIEIALTGGIGFLIALAIGIKSTTSIYIATALAFSSTVVIVKILSDKKELNTLHGKLALGILIVEDFVAAIALMALPLIENGTKLTNSVYKLGIIIVVVALIFLLANKVLRKVLDYLARNNEVLFLFGIAWALVLSALFDKLGFSLEIGALIAGMSFASTKYTLELSGKISPLRDFFVVLFFVFFGSQLAGTITSKVIWEALLFSSFILIGKPLIIMSLLGLFGYKKKTNFLAGSSLAQISEFSLVLILLGFNLGHISQEIMSLVVLIAIITISVSSYTIHYAHTIFEKIGHWFVLFEGKKNRTEEEKEKKYDVILFGYHRMGYKILEELNKTKSSIVVVDHNPKVILSLSKQKIDCIFGDASDPDFLSQIPLESAKLVISSISDRVASFAILNRLKKIESKASFIVTAEQPPLALDLYEAGADYVIVPHHLGGDYAAKMINTFHTSKEKYLKAGKEHLSSLRKAKHNSKFKNNGY